MNVNTITRHREEHRFGQFAWNWRYTVHCDNSCGSASGNAHGCTTLSEARALAKRLHPGHPIIESWKGNGDRQGLRAFDPECVICQNEGGHETREHAYEGAL